MKRIAVLFSLVGILACGTDPAKAPSLVAADAVDAGPLADLAVGVDSPGEIVAAACQTEAECPGAHCDLASHACVACRASVDCPPASVCELGSCVARTACQSDKPCSALNQVCDVVAGICVQCTSGVDCAPGELCKARTCIAQPVACETTKECNTQDLVCDKAAHVCVHCASDLDCAGGQWCSETRCVADACVGGTAACVDGQLTVCASNGAAVEVKACPAGEICHAGACKPTVCAPGAAYCDGSVAKACAADGLSATTLEDCGKAGAAQVCLGGKCAAQACQVGKQACADVGTLATCKADGSGWTMTPCPNGQACTLDTCKPMVCKPFAKACEGAKVAQCDASGTLSSQVQDCALADQVCVAGACTAKVCQAGQKTCIDASLASCNAGGTAWDKVSCAAGEVCASGVCKVTVCAANAKTCSGTQVLVCDATGTAQSKAEDCAVTAKTCQNGACVAQACQPGQKACVDGAVGTCKVDGSAWDKVACGNGQACSAGACKAVVCTANAKSCNGKEVQQCDASGTAQSTLENCATTGKSCAQGACVAPFCGDGAVNVAGEECDDGNVKDGDGCSAGCKVDKFKFVGFAASVFLLGCNKLDDAETDAILHQACAKAFKDSHAVRVSELVAKQITDLPTQLPGGHHIVPACPDCEWYGTPNCKSGHMRRAVWASSVDKLPDSLNSLVWTMYGTNSPTYADNVFVPCAAP